MDFTKPRIAIYYYVLASTGMRNDGAPLFSTYNLKKILGKENVIHLAPYGDVSTFGNFDLHLLIDHGEDALSVPLNFDYPHPNAYWCSDAHLGYEHRLNMAKKFDFVFCAQRRAMEEFERDGVPRGKLFWLPHAAEQDCYKPYPIVEKWDWSFIGHLNSQHRIDLLDRFCKEFPNFYLGWRRPEFRGYNVLDDAAKKFSQSRFIISDSVSDDINMRTFEAMACNRVLITNRIPHLEELFVDRQDLYLYDTIDEAVEKARLVLDHDGARKTVALNGYTKVLENHTYKHRMLTILKETIGYVPDPQEVAHAH